MQFSKLPPMQIQKKDYKYYVAKPDSSFNPDWNKAVIEGTIKKYESTRRRKAKEYTEKIAERSDAVATYLKSLMMGKGAGGNVEKYFGRMTLAQLRGQRIVQKLKRLSNGKTLVMLEEV